MDPMLGGQPIRSDFIKPSDNHVRVFLKDLYMQKDTLFIRYEIRNNTGNVYVPGVARVSVLSGVHSSQSLVGRENSQLNETEARKLTAKNWISLPVVDEKLRSTKLGPGEETVGVVAIKLSPSPRESQVLVIDFSRDGCWPVSATLVL
jgi:hypothetical protein